MKKIDDRVLIKLEFNKIVEILIGHCSTKIGKEKAAILEPIFEKEKIMDLLYETTEAKEIDRLFPNFSFGGIKDIRQSLNKAKAGGVLEPAEFLCIIDTLGAARRIKRFFMDDGSKYKQLLLYAEGVLISNKLEQNIRKVVGNDGEINETASAELTRIRKHLRNQNTKVREKLDSLLRLTEIQKYLQDSLVTVRNGRFVLPVKQEYRGQLPGLIHDQSASGATLFIEPMAIVEMTNEIHRYEAMEQAEILRILRELTALVENEYPELLSTSENIGMLDFIFGKAKLSADLDCGMPLINDRGFISIKQGRHPLIKGEVVPITIRLGGEFDVLVITGPNTGGKTVTLKTVGLFTLMAQAGLHVPAQIGTELAVFDKIFVDIGDEQSIEQSLSTFSSHMENIINILDFIDEKALVLLDELGAGTDPTEGAALAMAILEELLYKKSKAIATTHYSELKSFAYKQNRVENASVEFDIETLRPTYRLLIGIPGRSNAFEISLRLGLKKELVERARGFISQEEILAADLIANLETNQILSEKERIEAEDLKKAAKEVIQQLEKREKELREKSGRILENARKEALEITMKARQESDGLIKEIKEKIKNAAPETKEELAKVRGSLLAMEEKLRDELYSTDESLALNAEEISPGDLVLIKRIGKKAIVLENPTKDGVLVQAGIIKATVKLNEIIMLQEEKNTAPAEKTGAGRILSAKSQTIKPEIDLRGYSAEDAVIETEKYLDDAFLAGLPKVRIIHGKGAGVLRSAIGEMLKKHRFVSSVSVGGYYDGGQGVTIVELNKKDQGV